MDAIQFTVDQAAAEQRVGEKRKAADDPPQDQLCPLRRPGDTGACDACGS